MISYPHELPKPSNEADFEQMCAIVYGEVYGDSSPNRNGRRGQKQFGVDIYLRFEGGLIGIQCKRYQDGALRYEDIIADVNKVEAGNVSLSLLLFATTSASDAALLQKCLPYFLERKRSGQFDVRIDFWEEIQVHVSRYENLQRRFSPNTPGGALYRIAEAQETANELLRSHRRRKTIESPAVALSKRVRRIFEVHGVNVNQIPSFFGHGLRHTDLIDEYTLLEKLDEKILQAVCDKFAISRGWLDGVEATPHLTWDFYKDPESFAQFIQELTKGNPNGHIDGVVLIPDTPESDTEAIIILRESIGVTGTNTVYRYHLLNNWYFSYWKARAYLTSCIAIAWKNGIYLSGRRTRLKALKHMCEATKMVAPIYDEIMMSGLRWYPEELALEPRDFLLGIDREEKNAGAKMALQMWLKLDDGGLMDVGLNREVRGKFELQLARE